MLDRVKVNIDRMYELSDEMERCRHAANALERELCYLTTTLESAMSGCSRHAAVSDEIGRACRSLEKTAACLDRTERDLLHRAEFLESFERGELNRNGWRDDSI